MPPASNLGTSVKIPPVPSFLARLLHKVGIDRAIAFTLVGRGWAAFAGFVNLFLITRLLSATQQGYYYTFGSVLNLTIFFELGLSYVLIQFASHERANLEWSAQGTLEGNDRAKMRLASLMRMSLIWYAVMALLITVMLLPSGLVFFGTHAAPGVSVSWRLPWTWIVLSTAVATMIIPIYTILEGAGLIKEIVSIQALQGFAASLFCWTSFGLHAGLLAAPIGNTAALLVGIGWLWWKKRGALRDLLSFPARCSLGANANINWRKEVWPFQWKIAISGISGFFISQLFNPLLFAAHGAAAAGRMGLCITVMTAISTIAVGWITTKSATFGTIIARRDYAQLDRLFFPALWQSLTLVTVIGGLFWAAAFYLHQIHHRLSLRILDPIPLGLLIVTGILNHVIASQALYLRAHKQEPLLWLSVAGAICIGLGSLIVAKPFGALGLMLVYFLVTVVLGLGCVTWVFIQKRKEWHSDADPPFLESITLMDLF